MGWACVKISSICINKGGEFNFDVFYDDSVVGTLTLLSVYTPYQLLQTSFDSDHVKNLTKDIKNNIISMESDINEKN